MFGFGEKISEAEMADLIAEEKEARAEAEAHAAEIALCEAGLCDHYTCTEGRSLDEWSEPEPTLWDYQSEAFGPTARDAADLDRWED